MPSGGACQPGSSFRTTHFTPFIAMAQDIILDPDALSERDFTALKKHRAHLAEVAAAARNPYKNSPRMTVRLRVGEAEEEVALPPSLAGGLAAALAEVADGRAVHLAPVTDELTTQEAADLLNVSRPFLVKVLDQGAMPHRKVGTHRRVRRADVLAYKAQMYQQAEAALQDLADQAQELGLGYE